MKPYEERAREIERMARLICIAMDDNPDALQMRHMPYQAPSGAWVMPKDEIPHFGWMRYWRAAAAIYADAEFKAHFSPEKPS